MYMLEKSTVRFKLDCDLIEAFVNRENKQEAHCENITLD